MAIRVRVHRTLQEKLAQPGSALSKELLAQRFREWIDAGGDDRCSKWFATTKIDPQTQVSHVHMAPVQPCTDTDNWFELWDLGDPAKTAKPKPYRRSERTSDCYLMYAFGGDRHGYLLIDVLFDPGAHDLWSTDDGKELQDIYAEITHRFLVSKA